MKVPVLFLLRGQRACRAQPPSGAPSPTACPSMPRSFGIAAPPARGESWDMLAIRQGRARGAQPRCRAGEPFVLEIVTVALQGACRRRRGLHFNYRTGDGVDAWKRRDPLIVDRKLVEALRPDIEREIEAAVAFAEASPAPVAPNC